MTDFESEYVVKKWGANPVEDVDEKSWVPYTGPRGGSGWRNVATGDVDYSDEPPGGVDMGRLDDGDLFEAAAARLGEERAAELIEQTDGDRAGFEEALAEEMGVPTAPGSESTALEPSGLDDVPADADPAEFDPDEARGSLSPGDEVVFSAGAHGVYRGIVQQAPETTSFDYVVSSEDGAWFEIDADQVSSYPGQGMDPSALEVGLVVSTGSAFGEVIRTTESEPRAAYVDFTGDGESDDLLDANQLAPVDIEPSDGPRSINAGDVTEGDNIVIEGARVEVNRVADMGGGWYIAGRDADGEVHTARVGPKTDFDAWAEGPDVEASPGDRVTIAGEGEVEVASIDRAGCAPNETELTDVNGQTYCVIGDDVSPADAGSAGYDVTEGEFDAELAEAVTSGEPMGTNAIYKNMGKVDDPELVADALELELATKNRKTARERLESKLGTFDDGPTVDDVRARLREDTGPAEGAGVDVDYPGDFDSAADELKSFTNSREGRQAVLGAAGMDGRRRGYDLDAIERLSEHATTEELEAVLEENTDQFDLSGHNSAGKLIAGMLHYREDSDVNWEDAVGLGDSIADQAAVDADDVRASAGEAFDALDPKLGALTMAHINGIKVRPRPADKPNRLGVYKHTNQSIEVHGGEGPLNPSTTKHEIAHGMQFALGVTGNSSVDNKERPSGRPSMWDMDVDARTDDETAVALRDDIEGEIDRYKQRIQDGASPRSVECRQYQRTNGNEFIAVTFAHWQDDRTQLERKHPEMADLWDRHAGGGVETAEVDLPNVPDTAGITDPVDVDVNRGDRVNVRTTDGREFRNAELDSTNASGLLAFAGPEDVSLEWDDIEGLEKRVTDGSSRGSPVWSISSAELSQMDHREINDELWDADDIDVTYGSLGNMSIAEGMEVDEVTTEGIWLRDPSLSGPESESHIPFNEISSIDVYD